MFFGCIIRQQEVKFSFETQNHKQIVWKLDFVKLCHKNGPFLAVFGQFFKSGYIFCVFGISDGMFNIDFLKLHLISFHLRKNRSIALFSKKLQIFVT